MTSATMSFRGSPPLHGLSSEAAVTSSHALGVTSSDYSLPALVKRALVSWLTDWRKLRLRELPIR